MGSGQQLSDYQQQLLDKYKSGEKLTMSQKMDLIGDPQEIIRRTKQRQAEAELFYNVGEERATQMITDFPDLTIEQLVKVSRKQMSPSMKSFDSGFFKYANDPSYWNPKEKNYGLASDRYFSEFFGKAKSKAERNLFFTHFQNLRNQTTKVEAQHQRWSKQQRTSVMNYDNAGDRYFALSQRLYSDLKTDLKGKELNKARALIGIVEGELLKDIGSPEGGKLTEELLSGDIAKIEGALEELKNFVQLPGGEFFWNEAGERIIDPFGKEDDPARQSSWYNHIIKSILNNRKLLRKVNMPETEKEVTEVGGFKIIQID